VLIELARLNYYKNLDEKYKKMSLIWSLNLVWY